MIAKRITRSKPGSIEGLCIYITKKATRLNDDDESPIWLKATNCGVEEEPELAGKVMAATQALSTRTKKDKSYHLVISFPSGEQPTAEQMTDIEENVCKRLGFGDHQRLSAVHTDTANTHLHVAISRVNPESLKTLEPFRDFYILDEVCKEMEQKHGLLVDNRIDRTDQGKDKTKKKPPKIVDIETHSGIQTFHTWLSEPAQTDQLAEIHKNSNSWDELNEGLADMGLSLRTRGAGLVITNDKIWAKASSIKREWGKSHLEKRFGEYKESSLDNKKKPKKEYTWQPTTGESTELWQQYQEEKASKAKTRQQNKDSKSNAYDRFKNLRTMVVNDNVMDSDQKNDLLSMMKAIRDGQLRGIAKRNKESASQSWTDYLTEKAANGNSDALEALRQRKETADRKAAQGFAGKENNAVPLGYNALATKRGSLWVRMTLNFTFRDDGEQVAVHGRLSTGIAKAATYAHHKWNQPLRIFGPKIWQEHVVTCVVRENADVKFANERLEAMRKRLTDEQASVAAEQEEIDKKTKVKIKAREKAETRKRTIGGTGEIDAIDKWIVDRNKTGERLTDWLPIERHAKKEFNGVYQGVRNCGKGMNIALIENDGKVTAIPISDYQKRRWQSQKVGIEVEINQQGQQVSDKGVSR